MRKPLPPRPPQKPNVKESAAQEKNIKKNITYVRPAVNRQQIKVDPQCHIDEQPTQPQNQGQHDPSQKILYIRLHAHKNVN
jgi:hypothetical protein